jgi:hypothetical protein
MKSRASNMSMFHPRLFSARVFLVTFSLMSLSAITLADVAGNEAAKSLPQQIGPFRAMGPVEMGGSLDFVTPDEVGPFSNAARYYQDAQGSSFHIHLVRTETDSAAYALLTRIAGGKDDIKKGLVGAAAIITSGEVGFCKGSDFVQVSGANKAPATSDKLLTIARSFSETLPAAEDDVPVLVQHLPNWQAVANRSAYAVTLSGLKNIVPNQPVLDTLSFEGGTEAVVANYGGAQLVIVEFTTPQFSIENDQRIWTKIPELKNAGQPGPIGYRRVGNYSVFVFNATDEKTANELIDQVKYEKVVQWLGEDPHLYERLQRYLTQTSAGVLAAVLKSSGLSLLICVGVGTLFGALLFRRRRAQQAALYSDAGGAVRLNLDEMTGASNSHRLLGPGKQPGSDSNQF